jgi:hypothetical protein
VSAVAKEATATAAMRSFFMGVSRGRGGRPRSGRGYGA